MPLFPPIKGEGNELVDVLSEIELCGIGVYVKSFEGLGMKPLKIWEEGTVKNPLEDKLLLSNR